MIASGQSNDGSVSNRDSTLPFCNLVQIIILYICILSHLAISLPLFFSVFCAAYWCFFKTLLVFSTLCRFNFKITQHVSAQFGHLRVLILVVKEIAVPFCRARSSLLFLVCACSLLLSCLLVQISSGSDQVCFPLDIMICLYLNYPCIPYTMILSYLNKCTSLLKLTFSHSWSVCASAQKFLDWTRNISKSTGWRFC
jgi:hypothetical protein